MQLQQVYIWAKKIHRFMLWFVTVLGLWMMTSGYLMHHELEGTAYLSSEMMLFIRYWHNGVSQYFLVVLLLQMLTGLSMWAIPKLIAQGAKNKA
jgi:hypothetical protein